MVCFADSKQIQRITTESDRPVALGSNITTFIILIAGRHNSFELQGYVTFHPLADDSQTAAPKFRLANIDAEVRCQGSGVTHAGG